MELKAILESLIFAADKPITLKQLKSLTGSTRAERIRAALDDIEAEYRQSGIQLVEVGGGFQFRTHPDCASYVKKLLAGRPPRLTQAMLETLAIVAYRQPVTRPEIEDIRGVDSGGVLRLLLDRVLIRMLGKKEEPGRPILYGTTRQFLEFFNLGDLTQLPTLREFTELSEEMATQLDPEEALLVEAGQDGDPEPQVAAEQLDGSDQAAPGGDATAAQTTPADAAPPAVAEMSSADAAPPAAAEMGPADAAPQPLPTEKGQSWPRAAAEGLDDEEDEDAALVSLERAVSRVDDILRAQRRKEREELAAKTEELSEGDAVAPAPVVPGPVD